MRIRRKTENCLNCGSKLNSSFEYCPVCGQENNDLQLTFGQMLRDFFANYFTMDSRFGKSIRPFFLQPGFLTNEFMKGKRVSYANPIRWYLVISVLHFFIFSLYYSTGIAQEDSRKKYIPEDIDVQFKNGKKVIPLKGDSVNFSFSTDSADLWSIEKNITIIQSMSSDHSSSEIYDSLHLENESYFTQLTWKQATKLSKDGTASLGRFFLKNIPILMFFLLPLYALILKMFFSKILYISHMVHSLHIHSFLFIILTFIWLITMIFNITNWLLFIAVFLMSFYIIHSFKKVFVIPTKSAFWMLLGSGSIYTFILLFALAFTFAISFYTY